MLKTCQLLLIKTGEAVAFWAFRWIPRLISAPYKSFYSSKVAFSNSYIPELAYPNGVDIFKACATLEDACSHDLISVPSDYPQPVLL